MPRCPHCGNTNANTIQDNGESATSPDLTLFCANRVAPSEWSFDVPPAPDVIGPDGKVPCAMQWEPNRG